MHDQADILRPENAMMMMITSRVTWCQQRRWAWQRADARGSFRCYLC